MRREVCEYLDVRRINGCLKMNDGKGQDWGLPCHAKSGGTKEDAGSKRSANSTLPQLLHRNERNKGMSIAREREKMA